MPADPITEYAGLVELAAARRQWHDAENNVRQTARRMVDEGVPARVVAESLDMSRATLFRWFASDFK